MAKEMRIEEALDRDFLLFISLTKTYYPQIVDQKDITLCNQWLSKLCAEKVQGITQKRNRNLFLSHLLMNMQEGKMAGPFVKLPGVGPLPAARAIFGPPEQDETVASDENIDPGEMADDFQERSGDGRTYVATRCLPNNQGTYAFVALNIDKDEEEANKTLVVPCTADRSKLHHLKALYKLNSSVIGKNPSESQMEDFYIRNIEAKVSGDISKLYPKMGPEKGKPCGRNKSEVMFYDVLLKQIDEEIKGPPSGQNDLVNFLVGRLKQDLRRVPKMKHIFQLKADQQHLKVLEILRQKLVVRQQGEKRRHLLAEMEECMTASSVKSESCMGRTGDTTESMWQLAVTRPLAEIDIGCLYDKYPEEAIATFVDMLAEDRQAILMRGKKRQNNLIESMRAEVYKEVQHGKSEYNKARATYREWNDILSFVEDLVYQASNEVMEEVPQQKEQLLTNMITNIKQTENLVVEEAQRGEILTEKIVDANEWKFSTADDNGKDASWDMKSTIENLRKEVESYKLLIKNQKYRIHQLRSQLDYQ